MELTTREACCEGNAIRESVHTLACLMRPRYAARARTQGEPDPETDRRDRGEQVSDTNFAWEPKYGFCAGNRTNRMDLAEALEGIRRQICAYNGGQDRDVRCDCKYGRGARRTGIGSEATGCPELRELIHRLLHRPETFAEITATESGVE